MGDTSRPAVLAVDDDEKVVETFGFWLDGRYDLRTATGGEEALARLDEDVDVVLLDRLMPGMSGDEVLSAIEDRDVDPAIAVVTAVEPDVDIAPLRFDTSLTKALDRGTVVETIERLLDRRTCDRSVREQYALVEKLAALEAYRPAGELAEREEYVRLRERFADVNDGLVECARARDDEELAARLRSLSGNGG